jgi:hypothetical protein
MATEQQPVTLEDRLSEQHSMFCRNINSPVRADLEIKAIKRRDEKLRIPSEDLRIIEKLYHKAYPDAGRKRGALLRYIRDLRENNEPSTQLTKNFIKYIKRETRTF